MGVKVVVDSESESDEIEFDLMKPVWRMNTGTVPSDRLKDSSVLEMSGRLAEGGHNNFN